MRKPSDDHTKTATRTPSNPLSPTTASSKTSSSSPTHPVPARSARTLRLWVSTQPGAWFMAVTPALGGMIIGGMTWRNLWLLLSWILCYCVQYTGSRWMASHWSPRYRIPALVYAGATAVIGIPLIVFTPQLLWWIPYYAVLAAVTFLAAIRHQERSLWANAADVLASGMMCLIAAALGFEYVAARSGRSWSSWGGSNTGLLMPWGSGDTLILNLSRPIVTFGSSAGTGTSAIPGMIITMPGLIATMAFIVSQYGSVLFVKTMIRRYGDRRYYALSVIWHVLLCIPASTHGIIWALAALLLLARAAVFPLRKTRMRPQQVGLIETVASTIAFVAIVAFV